MAILAIMAIMAHWLASLDPGAGLTWQGRQEMTAEAVISDIPLAGGRRHDRT